MKINANQIPFDGLTLEEEVSPREIELETERVRLRQPVKAKAGILKITNAVSVNLTLNASIYTDCSRCLNEVKIDLNKEVKLNYRVSSPGEVIDLNPDIREEIILEYPIKPLCKPDCKGLCPKCGKNLNEGSCKCVNL